MTGHDMLPQTDHELEPRIVDTFVVLDLDRTLLDSDASVDAVCMLLINHGVSEAAIREEIAYIHSQRGNSFPTLDYLIEKYSAKTITKIKHEMITLAQESSTLDNLLYDGAAELFDELESHDIPFGVLTYGQRENQSFKIALLRAIVNREPARLPAKITEEKYKGEWIHAAWQHDDGKPGFDIVDDFTQEEPIHADRIVIVDDKIDHIKTVNDAIEGFLVDNSTNRTTDGQPIRAFTAHVQALQPGETLSLAA